MSDQQITCVSCGQRFTWSAGEQAFYRERGLSAPRRCPGCREARRRGPAAAQGPPRSAPRPPRPLARRPGPRRTFGAAALVAAVALGAALLLALPSSPLPAWLVAVNLVALLAYGYDKAAAGGGQTRVPEVVLLGLALAGGSAGALAAMLLLRHKTSKPAFLVPFGLIVLLQVALILAWPLLRESL